MAKHGIKYWQEDYRRRGKTLTDAQIQSLLDNRLANEDRDPYEIMLWKDRMGSGLSGVEQGSDFKPPKVEAGRGTAGSSAKGQASPYGPRVDYSPQDLTPMPTEKIQKAYTGVSDAERFKRFQLKREDAQNGTAFEKGFSSVFATGGKGNGYINHWTEKTQEAQKKAADRNATDFWVDLQNDHDEGKWVPYKALDGTLYRNGEKVGYEPPTDFGDGMAWPTKEHPMAASDFLTIYRNAPPEEVETMLRDGRLKVDPGFDFALYNRDAQAKRQVEEDRRAALDGLPEEEEPIQTVSRYLQENPGANNEDVVRLLDQGGLINDTMINFHQAAANDAMDRELESWHDQNDTDRQLVDHYLREEGYITPFLQEDGTMTINGEIVGFYDRKTGKKKWYEPMIVTIPAISDMLKMPGALMAYKTMPEEFDIIYQAVTRKDGPNKEDKEKLKKLSLYLNNILYDINLNGEEVTPEMRTAANAMQDIINAIPLNDSFPLSFLQRLNMMGGSALDSVRNLSAQTISKATGLDGSDYYAARASAYRGGASYKIDNGFVRFMIDRGIDAAQSALILAAVGSDPTLSKLAMAGNTATETAYAVKLAGGSHEQQQMAAFVGGLAEFIFYQAPSFGGEDVLEKTLTKKLKNLDSDLSEAAIKRLAQASAMTILENKNQGYSKERSMEELQKALLDALGDVVEDFIH